jgi:hypothetical protein
MSRTQTAAPVPDVNPTLAERGHESAKHHNGGPKRFTKDYPCPACHGWQRMPRRQGVRCAGMDLEGGEYFLCTREDQKGALLAPHPTAVPTSWVHRRTGLCDCGATHEAATDQDGCTLAQYADDKQLDASKLAIFGLYDISKYGPRGAERPAVGIPYHDEDGNERSLQIRVKRHGPDHHRWKKGNKPCVYGQRHLQLARDRGQGALVEGASDVHTLVLEAGYPAFGLPGADGWNEERDAKLFDGIPKIVVNVEKENGKPDSKNVERLLEKLAASKIRDRVHLLDLDTLFGVKDPSDLYLKDREHFKENWAKALEQAEPFSEYLAQERQQRQAALYETAKDLLHSPRILDRVAEAVSLRGLIGEEKAAKLLFLTQKTVLAMSRPVSTSVRGPSSAGKNFTVERVYDLVPPSGYVALTGFTVPSLFDAPRPLTGCTLLLFELAGLQDEIVTYVVRSLLSEQCLRRWIKVKTAEGWETEEQVIEGPINFVSTTTAVNVDPELDTRLTSIPTNDSRAQTKRINDAKGAAAAGEKQPEVDLAPWHALHEWVRLAEHRVVIPWGRELAAAVPPAAIRLRRDFPVILALIQMHAILHQCNRERTPAGEILADADDYLVVRDLMADLVAEGVKVTISKNLRETVEATQKALDAVVVRPGAFSFFHSEKTVTVAAIVKHLPELDHSAVWRRVQQAIEENYLRNEETRPRKPAKITLGEPLPADEGLVLPLRTPWLKSRKHANTDEKGIPNSDLGFAWTSANADVFATQTPPVCEP